MLLCSAIRGQRLPIHARHDALRIPCNVTDTARSPRPHAADPKNRATSLLTAASGQRTLLSKGADARATAASWPETLMGAFMYQQSANSRQFVASPGFFGIGANFSAKRSYTQLYGLVAVIALPTVVIGVMGAGHAHAAQTAGRMVSHVMPVLLVLGIVGWFAYYNLHNNRKSVISVTGDALTINKRPGDVYAFSDARLGRWAYNDKAMGTVLHLHSGADRFVLGGRDHRVGEGTRIDEPPVVGVDAWLPGDEFGELLGMTGPGSGLDVHLPAPGGPVRCLLFANAMRVQQTGAFAMAKRRRILQSTSHAQLAIDVDADEIRVVDYSSNTLITSAGLDQVSAEPATYQYRRWGMPIPAMGNVWAAVGRAGPRPGRRSIPVGDTRNGRVTSWDGGTDDCLS
jgi:hypothetical protein